MTLERRNPLPAGRYWIDVADPRRTDFTTWLAVNKDSVHVTNTEASEGPPASDFYIFTVAESVSVPGGTGTINVPVQWDAVSFGFPTVAGPEVQSKADTRSAPDLPKDATDQLSDALDSVGSFGKAVAIGGLAVAAAYLIGKLLEGRKGRSV